MNVVDESFTFLDDCDIFRPIQYLKRTYMLITFRFRFVTTTTVLVIIMKKLMQLNTRYGNKFTI